MPRKKSDADRRQARAKELRAEIDQLTGKPAPPKSPESPAAFVHRRMAELAQEEREKESRKRS